MSVPAWKRMEPSRLSVFCVIAPKARPRKNVMTVKMRREVVYCDPK